MVVLGVEDEMDLIKWMWILHESGVRFKGFWEPDRGNEATALTAHPSADPKLFRKLRLL